MPIVHEEDQNVCSRLYDKNEHHLLIDISYYKCRINFEVFHAMADATGALMFLKTLVVEKRIRTASVSIITRKRKIQVCPS